ncbi:MAG: YigZ family protein, partial [Paracoccaceae bacterium]|nr:YigZ family protein [Paracoccaceae bacterium]
EVQLSISILKKEKKFAKASHNSWAVILSNKGPLKHDDGEAGAGALILKMLEQKELKNHLIIVTRWFGGINLGGDRFKNIKYCVNHFLKNYK